MELKQASYFLALAETLNFTKAAERCGISQPALTQSIRRLEGELGGKLIRREGRRTRLTPFGNAILKKVQALHTARDAVLNTARAQQARTVSVLEFGLMCTIGARKVAPMLASYKSERSDLELTLHDTTVENLPALLASGVFDIAIASDRVASDERVTFYPLYEEALMVACAPHHPFASRDYTSLAEIAAETYLDRLKCEFRDVFLDYFETKGLPLRIGVSSDREDWIQCLVAAGAGVSTMPEDAVLLPELKRVRFGDNDLTRTIGLAVLKDGKLSHLSEDLFNFAIGYSWKKS